MICTYNSVMKRVRTERLDLRMYREERAYLEEMARRDGVTMTEYIMRMVRGKEIPPEEPVVEPPPVEVVTMPPEPTMCPRCSRAHRVGLPVPANCEECVR